MKLFSLCLFLFFGFGSSVFANGVERGSEIIFPAPFFMPSSPGKISSKLMLPDSGESSIGADPFRLPDAYTHSEDFR